MKNILLALMTFLCQTVMAQKEDYRWVIGHDYNFDDSLFGRLELDFNTSPPTIKHLIGDVNMNMFACNASISDSTGRLLFYSNGCDVADENGNFLPNGTNINPGSYHTTLCEDIARGYFAGYPSMVILPLPESDSIFYLFHMRIEHVSSPVEDAYVDRLLYTVVRKGDGFPKSYVVGEKNLDVIQDSLATGEMNAVKHANGKDWWIILPRRNSNQFYIFLFTKDGIVDTLTQTIGEIPLPENEAYGQTTFSPFGDKMIRCYPQQALWLYHFDRATGSFTSFDTIHVEYGNFIAFDVGCAVSPNGRFLYITALTKAYQFDLLAPDISATQTTIATWDGFLDPVAISFWLCQLGPDCKIYVVGGGDTRYYHIIHNPDEPGLACNFEQRGLVFPIPSGASIPYFPNYRLGPIDNPGLPCTATVSTSQPVLPIQGKAVWVYPNPASSSVTIEYQDVNGLNNQFLLFNTLGQLVQSVVLPHGQTRLLVPIEELPEGVYWYVVSGLENVSGKVVVRR